MNITRDVVADLWPLYVAGEASKDSRQLIDEFLKEDPEFAVMLTKKGADGPIKPVALKLPPDLEARAFTRTRRALQGRSVFRILALAFTGLAIVRLVADMPFDKQSPTNALGTMAVAVLFWIVFLVHRRHLNSIAS
jgi:hypothetical protein